MRIHLVGLLAVLAVSTLQAQKNCTKGIPCGNTCIAANKVCRIGSSSSPPAAPAAARPTPLLSAPASPGGAPGAPWVAFRDGTLYYKNVAACEPTQVPARADRVYFQSAEDAERFGLIPSTERACQGAAARAGGVVSRSTLGPATPTSSSSVSLDTVEWIGSRRSLFYFKARCIPASTIPTDERVYFRTETRARESGYQRAPYDTNCLPRTP